MTKSIPAPRTPLDETVVSPLSAPGGLDFVAIDVETANSRRGSICAIGVAVVRGGAVVSSHSWLTRPPAGLDRFDGVNVSLHGITPEMVADQPDFGDRLDQLLAITEGLPLVAHNAAFDMGALREACVAIDRDWPATDYGCSLIMARRALDLISYRLPTVASECGVELAAHHEAGADALACAQVVLEIARRRRSRSLSGLFVDLQVLTGRLEAAAWRGCRATLSMTDSTGPWLPGAASDADPEHPLYGQVVVFTGALSVRRQEAWDAVAACGAEVEKGVNKRTTMLVVGDGFTGHDPADFWTGKAEKAVRWREKGHRIEVLTEGDLVDLLAETRTSGVRDARVA
jgi:DNA polymerase-3 subunit epsilon